MPSGAPIEDGSASRLPDTLRRRWRLVVALVVLLAVAGVAIGWARKPVYTASAQLSVGTSNVNTPQALGGFAASAPTLAAAYSRAVVAQSVIRSAAHDTGLEPTTVRDRVTASSVPQTPVIRIDARGPNARSAEALADATSAALVRYAGDLNTAAATSGRLLHQYKRARADYAGAVQDRTQIERASGGTPSAELRDADAAVAAAKLRVQTLAQAYRTSQQSLGASNPLQSLGNAVEARSDHLSRMQLYGLTGALVGLLLGCALAVAVDVRRQTPAALHR